MKTSTRQFRELLKAPEGAHLECKEARRGYSFDTLLEYCVALANEDGGKIVLGVSDRRPRKVLGTAAFPEPGRTEAGLHQRLGHHVPIEELHHDGKRVLIVHVPGCLPGAPWHIDGRYIKRIGDALAPLGPSDLQSIFDEGAPDFSAQPCEAGLDDLSPEALGDFRSRWAQSAENPRIEKLSDEQMLDDAGLRTGGKLTYAALLLFGKPNALRQHLAQGEIIFEYRSSEKPGPAQDRVEFREGFLLIHDRIWGKVNLRNDRQSYLEKFTRHPIPMFDETMVREAVLNAFAHRDYRSSASVFVRQYRKRIEIVSPGGLPRGVEVDNIIDQQKPRNPCLSDALARAGLVERAGQGLDIMFETAVRQSKPLPSFQRSDAHWVFLTLEGVLQDPEFVIFLERLKKEELLSNFSTHDFLALDAIVHKKPLTEAMRARLPGLVEAGIVERQGRGRGTRYFLSPSLYVYRSYDLSREEYKELLMQHLKDSGEEGATLGELLDVLPVLSRGQIRGLLQELAAEGRARNIGVKRTGRWIAVNGSEEPDLTGDMGSSVKTKKNQKNPKNAPESPNHDS